jgi:hypothetical protein
LQAGVTPLRVEVEAPELPALAARAAVSGSWKIVAAAGALLVSIAVVWWLASSGQSAQGPGEPVPAHVRAANAPAERERVLRSREPVPTLAHAADALADPTREPMPALAHTADALDPTRAQHASEPGPSHARATAASPEPKRALHARELDAASAPLAARAAASDAADAQDLSAPVSDRVAARAASSDDADSWRAPAAAPERAEPPPLAASLEQETALLEQAQAALRRGAPQRALALLAEHTWRFPSGHLTESREVARILALCQAGNATQARAQADRFLAARPGSPFSARVRASCPPDTTSP